MRIAGAQAGFYISQAISVGQLAKSHAQELVPTRERFNLIVTAVAADATLKLLAVNEVGQLGEGKFVGKHSASWRRKCCSGSAEEIPENYFKSDTPQEPDHRPANTHSSFRISNPYPDGSEIKLRNTDGGTNEQKKTTLATAARDNTSQPLHVKSRPGL